MTKETVDSAIETAVISHLHPEGSYAINGHSVPTGREEIWRFTPMRRLAGMHDQTDLVGCKYEIDLALEKDVSFEMIPLKDERVTASGYVPTNRAAAKAWHAAERVGLLTIPAELVTNDPSAVHYVGSEQEIACAEHVVVHAQRHSKATVILRFRGHTTSVDLAQFIVEEGADLTVITVQGFDDDAIQLLHQHAQVGRDAKFRHINISLGGDLLRNATSVKYADTGGEAEMIGLYFVDAGEHVENRLFVDHNQPSTVSNVDYRGALQGNRAHAVWVGDVLIRKVAEGIETYESNKNLLLTDGCRADSVPNLEIETGEIVGAGHASTTGRFDDEQLFYLESRGIPEAEAKRLVVRGFFAELVRKIGIEELEEEIMEVVEDEIAIAVANPTDEETETQEA
ncbi:MAG: Fe-S cluster assembly protein SufD [Propionibacteriales bacterium]|nr:MAG: Fe-S cluster assembly protein SufD [Propionibacteriales bacterium]